MTAPDEALRALALAATPGPWRATPGGVLEADDEVRTVLGQIANGGVEGRANLGFVLAANPTAVLRLLDELDALRGAVERVRALADGWGAVRDGVLSPGLRRATDELHATHPGGQIMGVNHDFAVGGPLDTPLRAALDGPA